jgi:hypothetical protein
LLIAYQKCSNAVKITNYRDLIPINQIKGQMKITKKKLNRPTVKKHRKTTILSMKCTFLLIIYFTVS